MAEIAKQTITPQARTFQWTAASEYGDHTTYERSAKLLVFNDSGSPVTVTVASEAPVRPPTGPEDLEVTIAAGRVAVVKDINDALYRDSSGEVHWTYSSEADVYVAVIQD